MKQNFKSIYFPNLSDKQREGKSITIAFNKSEDEIFRKIKNLSNEEIRELIRIDNYNSLVLNSKKEYRNINQLIKLQIKKNLNTLKIINSEDFTFRGSKNIPFQRWYPFIEGYSPDFVKWIISSYCANKTNIYDPFSGTGTTIFAGDAEGKKTFYSEINPLLSFLIETKMKILKANIEIRNKLSEDIRNICKNIFIELNSTKKDYNLKENYKKIFKNSTYFDENTFSDILKLRNYLNKIKLEDDLLADSLTVGVLSSLIPISFLKKAGDIRFKTNDELQNEKLDLKEVLLEKLIQIADDIENTDFKLITDPELILYNSKKIGLLRNLHISAVITSPPYLNGTNYFRNTKLELWFLKYIQNENDLRLYRNQTLTSGINDVNSTKKNIFKGNIFEKSSILKNTYEELLKKTYDTRIPCMIKNYFEEMYTTFSGIKKHLTKNAKILIDIGDSIFASVPVKTDLILIEIFDSIGIKLKEKKLLRKRRSRNKEILSQTLLYFMDEEKKKTISFHKKRIHWNLNWGNFKKTLPHQNKPYSSRNWGHQNHSLCSYPGRLKPAIAFYLMNIFVPEKGSVLDPFCGVGTIPFEAALGNKQSYGFDISLPAYYISCAKVGKYNEEECFNLIEKLKDFILNNRITKKEILEIKNFGFNKSLYEYYEESTLKEIMLAKKFFLKNPPKSPSDMIVISSLLHILHGNRPYSLSRRSHPIIPYAPKGDFVYKNLIEKLLNKVKKVLSNPLPNNFKYGKIFNIDSTGIWPQEIDKLDAIITSPPFYDSTRFYLANWIRLWFTGWSRIDFKLYPKSFLEEKQKEDFSIYKKIFIQARERLKSNGIFVLHLGRSNKCNMAEKLTEISKYWFKKVDLFDESVEHCESHGIRDKGAVTSHQYLILS